MEGASRPLFRRSLEFRSPSHRRHHHKRRRCSSRCSSRSRTQQSSSRKLLSDKELHRTIPISICNALTGSILFRADVDRSSEVGVLRQAVRNQLNLGLESSVQLICSGDVLGDHQQLAELQSVEELTAVIAKRQLMITGSSDHTAAMWDAASGEWYTSLSHVHAVMAVAVSPDNKLIATGSADRQVQLWNAATGAWRLTLKGHLGTLLSLSFSSCGKWLASSSSDGIVIVWCMDNLGQRKFMFKNRGVHGKHSEVYSVCFSPDSCYILLACGDGKIQQRLASTGGLSFEVEAHRRRKAYHVSYDRAGGRVVTTSEDRTAKMWDVCTGKDGPSSFVKLFHTLRHTAEVHCATFSPDGCFLATASRNAYVWDVGSGVLLRTLAGHKDTVFGVAFSPDGLTITTASADGSAKVWDKETFECQKTLSGHHGRVTCICFAHQGLEFQRT